MSVRWLLLLSLIVSAPIQAQDFLPDDRYDGYPSSLYAWPSSQVDLTCQGQKKPYEPQDFHLMREARKFGLRKGYYTKEFGWKYTRTQETDECVWMHTRYGNVPVIRVKGTVVAQDDMHRDLFDLGPDISGERGCGNARSFGRPINVVVPPPIPPPAPQLPPAPVPSPSPTPLPERPAEIVYKTPRRVILVPERSHTNGLTFGGMLGEFDSAPFADALSQLTHGKFCAIAIRGRMFDVGWAHRHDHSSSSWRFTFAKKSIDDNSSTDQCLVCDVRVTRYAHGMSVTGVSIERVQSIGPGHWAVHPAITANLGVGAVSGSTDEVTYYGSTGVLIEGRRTQAREFLGRSIFPFAGAGVGVSSNIGRHMTLTVVAIGIEAPGPYYGGVKLTVWP